MPAIRSGVLVQGRQYQRSWRFSRAGDGGSAWAELLPNIFHSCAKLPARSVIASDWIRRVRNLQALFSSSIGALEATSWAESGCNWPARFGPGELGEFAGVFFDCLADSLRGTRRGCVHAGFFAKDLRRSRPPSNRQLHERQVTRAV